MPDISGYLGVDQIGWHLFVSVKEKKLTDFLKVVSHGRKED
jgi:hypothetical protein